MLRRMRPAGARSSPPTQISMGPRTLMSTWWLIPSAASSHLKATRTGRCGPWLAHFQGDVGETLAAVGTLPHEVSGSASSASRMELQPELTAGFVRRGSMFIGEEKETGMRSRFRVVMAVLFVLAVVSCGGDESSSQTTEESTPATAQDTEAPTQQAGDEDGEDSSGGEAGERSAVISIDGEATSYVLDDVTYSNVEGVEDLTFETCDPDFFGSGRFYAIGYAVDADGEVLVNDDGELAGIFTMDLPPADWEETQRDAPEFDVDLGELSVEIASPEEAAGGTMDWTIDDTTASGTAVFVDFENTYTVDFEIICEGSPTVEVDDLPTDDDSDGGNGGGLPLAGAGVGSFTADGESFDNVDVYSCEPFSFGSDPHPDDVSVLAYLGGTSGLEVEVSHSEGFAVSDDGEPAQFDQVTVNVFYSRQGDSGLEQFEGSAVNDAAGGWVFFNRETGEQFDLAEPPYVRDGDRMTGSLASLQQSWPDEGAATVDVTYDLEIPSEVNEEC